MKTTMRMVQKHKKRLHEGVDCESLSVWSFEQIVRDFPWDNHTTSGNLMEDKWPVATTISATTLSNNFITCNMGEMKIEAAGARDARAGEAEDEQGVGRRRGGGG